MGWPHLMIRLFQMIFKDKHILRVSGLFFAIAITDSRLHEIEKTLVVKAIKDYYDLRKADNDLIINSQTSIEEEIYQAISDKNPNAWELYNDFEDYYIKSQAEFSEKSKQRILASANEIGSSFAGKNKSELVLLARLSLLFKQT